MQKQKNISISTNTFDKIIVERPKLIFHSGLITTSSNKCTLNVDEIEPLGGHKKVSCHNSSSYNNSTQNVDEIEPLGVDETLWLD